MFDYSLFMIILHKPLVFKKILCTFAFPIHAIEKRSY
jgi:hypothetical protein